MAIDKKPLAAGDAGRMAASVLLVLSIINLLNYLDRYVLSAVLPWVEETFLLSDQRSGLLGSMFMLLHLTASPVCGYFGDRRTRKYLVAGGVFLWSLATIGSGLAGSYGTLLLMRALVGIGEAGYAVVAPGMIADLFGEERRGRMLAWFYVAIPVGTALGYVVGGTVGEHFGWRWAFFVAGAPGLLLALAALAIPEPERGAMDSGPEEPKYSDFWAGWRRVADSPVWWFDTLSTALLTFALGGLAFWMPTFFVRYHGTSGESTGIQLGLILLAAGLIATPLGGYLGDRVTRKRPAGHLEVCSVALLACVPLIAILPFASRLSVTLLISFFALFLLGLTIGPINAVLVGCVPAQVRATAVALNLILVHLLGDALSPWLIGWMSDATNLATAIGLTSVPVAVGALILALGARQINRRQQGLSYRFQRAQR